MDSTPSDRSSVLSRYFAEIREYPLLTKEEEMSLAQNVKLGRREALNELIESNLSFVVKVALRQAEQYRAATTAGEKSPGSFPLTSPIDGVVVQVDVTAGLQVDAISPLFTVADLSTVWIEAPVFEGDLGTIDTTSPVRIYNVGEEPRFWTGQPIHAGEVVDPLKRTANLLYEVANTDGFLKLGLSVTVALPVGETRRMPMIPESAVLAREAGKGVVYVRRSPTVFVERDVTVGVKRDGFVALVGDIQVRRHRGSFPNLNS